MFQHRTGKRRRRRLVIIKRVSVPEAGSRTNGRDDCRSVPGKRVRALLQVPPAARRRREKRATRSHRPWCRRFVPCPKARLRAVMFSRGPCPPSGGVVNHRAEPAASVVPPPTQAPNPFGMQQFNGQPVYSPFTPTDCNQLSYTFSSATPPMYSWANTNSTDIMK